MMRLVRTAHRFYSNGNLWDLRAHYVSQISKSQANSQNAKAACQQTNCGYRHITKTAPHKIRAIDYIQSV
jgi:hypothetical protein